MSCFPLTCNIPFHTIIHSIHSLHSLTRTLFTLSLLPTSLTVLSHSHSLALVSLGKPKHSLRFVLPRPLRISAFSTSFAPLCGACNTCSWQERTDPSSRSRSILWHPLLASSAESYSSFCGARQKFVSICKTFSLCARRGKFHIFKAVGR